MECGGGLKSNVNGSHKSTDPRLSHVTSWFLHCKFIYTQQVYYLKHFYLDRKVYCCIYNTSLQMKYFIRWCVKRLSFFFFFCHAWSCDFVEASTSTMPHHSMYDNHNHDATATATTRQPTAVVTPTPRPWGICKREGVGKLGMTKMGPNNVSHIVWALGEFFCFFLSCYFILMDIYRLYLQSRQKGDS